MRKAIYVNMDRCVKCGACEIACRRVNGGRPYIRVVSADHGRAVPSTCRQCDPALCAVACPWQALVFSEGVMRLDREKCTGCTLCLFACPFGMMDFIAEEKLPGHCDRCAERLAGGFDPACVLTCPSGALHFTEYAAFTAMERKRALARMLRPRPAGGDLP